MPSPWLADAVLAFHFLFVLFVTGGLALILSGARRWNWVCNRAFRILHLAAIALVAAESVLGIACPLTRWEDFLRGGAQERSFVGRWLARLLYYDFPEWAFALAYLAFALAVAWAWRAVPPRPRRGSGAGR